MKFIGSSYSAMKNETSGPKYFHGSDIYEDENGKRIEKHFKLVCHNCNAEGQNLKHENWYMSKETGEDLYISCICGHVLNTEKKEEMDKWKVFF